MTHRYLSGTFVLVLGTFVLVSYSQIICHCNAWVNPSGCDQQYSAYPGQWTQCRYSVLSDDGSIYRRGVFAFRSSVTCPCQPASDFSKDSLTPPPRPLRQDYGLSHDMCNKRSWLRCFITIQNLYVKVYVGRMKVLSWQSISLYVYTGEIFVKAIPWFFILSHTLILLYHPG